MQSNNPVSTSLENGAENDSDIHRFYANQVVIGGKIRSGLYTTIILIELDLNAIGNSIQFQFKMMNYSNGY